MSKKNGWERFLDQVLGAAQAMDLRKMVRGDFSGTVVLVGSGANGKTTLLRTLAETLPGAEWVADGRGEVLRIRADFHLAGYPNMATPWTVARFLHCEAMFFLEDAHPGMLAELLDGAAEIRAWAGFGVPDSVAFALGGDAAASMDRDGTEADPDHEE